MKAIVVAPGVTVPAAAIRMSVSRSSGPGGQNVNKVASKVELRVDLPAVVGLTPAARGRLDQLVQSRTDAEGNLLVTSQLTRDQSRNLEDARQKVRTLVARALVKPVPRRPTRPSRAAKERRLVGKRHQSERKRGRGRGAGDE
jgi:ribosome-associated protein